ERAAEVRVEEILLSERDREEFVRLFGERRLISQCREHAAHARVLRHSRRRLVFAFRGLSSLGLLTFPVSPRRSLRACTTAHALGRAAQEEAVRDAVLQLVRVGDGVQLVEAYDAPEVRDAADL